MYRVSAVSCMGANKTGQDIHAMFIMNSGETQYIIVYCIKYEVDTYCYKHEVVIVTA